MSTLTGRPLRLAVDPHRVVSGYDDATATYWVGQTWRIVGTMNAEDRQAVFALSLALARRFAVVRLDVPPPDVLREIAATMPVSDCGDARSFWLSSPSAPAALALLCCSMCSRYIAARDDPAAIAEAVEAYVIPQLEGIRPDRLRRYATDLRRLLGHPHGDRVASYMDELFRLQRQWLTSLPRHEWWTEADRARLLREVREWLWLYIARGHVAHRQQRVAIARLLNLEETELHRLCAVHFLLSPQVVDAVEHGALAALHAGGRTITVDEKSHGGIRGRLDWGRTMQERAIAGGDRSLYAYATPRLEVWRLHVLRDLLQAVCDAVAIALAGAPANADPPPD